MENTGSATLNIGDIEDHLHIRGEYDVAMFAILKNIGSSPHTWRIHGVLKVLMLSIGIISTYVENTPCFNGYVLS